MARRRTDYEKRRDTKLSWWAATIFFGWLAWQTGTLQLWVLPILTWVLYELCFCPTNCGVQTQRGNPCRNRASGRLYACKDQPTHQALKNDALRGLLGLRHSTPSSYGPTRGPRPQAVNPEYPPPEPASMEPRQRFMVYMTVVATIAGVVQAIWTVK